jgi:transposase-like protein
MSKARKETIRYSLSFKQMVVRELEDSGIGQQAISRKYNIRGGSTVNSWLIKFGKNHLLNKSIRIETMEEKDRIKQLEDEVKKLKLALADTVLAKRCLEVVIDEANKEYKTDLKKSFGDAVPGDSKKSSG